MEVYVEKRDEKMDCALFWAGEKNLTQPKLVCILLCFVYDVWFSENILQNTYTPGNPKPIEKKANIK